MPGGTTDVVVVDAVRTGVGRGHPEKGQYREVHPNELLGTCFAEVVDRGGVDAARVDDVIVGCVGQYGEQSINVGRNAWLQQGLPESVPATTVDRQCGSGQQAVAFAAASIAAGHQDLVIAGGVEHMGHVPFSFEERQRADVGTPWPPELLARHDLVPQGLAAELVADRWDVSREEMDELSLRSHQLAAAAHREGRFAREIAAVRHEGTEIVADQGIRPDTSLDALAALSPAFRPGGRVTAGNSSQISDGAAALLLASPRAVAELGLRARAHVVDHVAVGVDPVLMLTGPVPATRKLLERNGLQASDVDLFEVNEAFAPVLAMWQREIAADPDRVNVNGGAIALGHPLGCSGARLITTLIHELERSDGELGVVTMCCRGGLGTATLIRRV